MIAMKKIAPLVVALSLSSSFVYAGTMTYVAPVVEGANVEIVLPNGGFSELASEGRFLLDGMGLDAFCSEVTQGSVFPSEYTRTQWNDGSLALQLTGRLFNLYYPTYKFDSVGTAAMQSVLWEILEDTSTLNLSSGVFSLGAATDTRVTALANTMLSNVRRASNSSTYNFFNLRSAASQDLLQVVPTAVPNPGTALLLGLGLLPLLGMRFKAKLQAK
jgi:hypothetical protein